ncbi:MAG TPA: hypothetical protein VFX48_00265, partial [Saprospiraceae bacterium]|nr:hypothetical protein [Saprospiraceae bacterium]
MNRFISLMTPFLKGLPIMAFLFPLIASAQSYDGLSRMDGHQTTVYYSEGAKTRAAEMANRCDRVMAFYKEHLPFQPTVTLLVLSPKDWSKHTWFPVYGMPHYNDDKTLIVASENNDFWKSFIPPVDQLPAPLAQSIKNTYTDPSGQLSMQPFFDLLAIHELGHAYHFQAGLTMHRKWMGELFANIFLHNYIAEMEPEKLPALTIFPQMVVQSTDQSTLAYTSLQDLESKYDEIGQKYPKNYGWYQCRWH